MKIAKILCVASASLWVQGGHASPVTYNLDSTHTYPSFEVDHFGGASVWRGKFLRSSGVVVLDRAAGTGRLEVETEISSVDIGNADLDREIVGPEILDAKTYPVAIFKSSTMKFDGEKLVEVDGVITLHGVSRPLVISIDSFKCYQNPLYKREVCGIDGHAEFNRDDFGVDYSKKLGFKMFTRLKIQAEAIRAD
ncbi:YceI family protein [Burkholderia ambifaria]|uniref:YceI family protein n=1 Tax=Burkholderia ambifaria TaxID=152480 RepID=UPI000A2F55B5|nr:YceI family protein [Burkholderia ambifaria]